MNSSISYNDLTRRVSTRPQLRAFLTLRAAEIAATWPELEDLVLLKRVPSQERFGVLLWGKHTRGGIRTVAAKAPVIEQIVHALECQIDEAPTFECFGENGWRIVARLSRENIGAILNGRAIGPL